MEIEAKKWISSVFKSITAPITSWLSNSPLSKRSFLNLRAQSMALPAFFSISEFTTIKAPITSNPLGKRHRRSSAQITKMKSNKKSNFSSRIYLSQEPKYNTLPDSLRKSGTRVSMWMHLIEETMVNDGKNGEPMSHWREGSFLLSTSLGHRTRTLLWSFTLFIWLSERLRAHANYEMVKQKQRLILITVFWGGHWWFGSGSLRLYA